MKSSQHTNVNLKRLFVFLALLGIFFSLICSSPVSAASYTWTGAGTDNNWSTCANWGGVCPTSADTAILDATSTKDSIIDTTFGGTIAVLNINSGYTGTVALARSLTTTSTMTQAAGTFISNDHELTVTSTFTLSGGTFTAPSTIMYAKGNFAHTGGTFNHNSGTVNLNGNNQTISGSTTFYDLTKANNTFILTISAGTTQTVLNALTLSGKTPLTRLFLRSSTAGLSWDIDAQGTTRTITNIDVQDCNNVNATTIVADTGSKDAGHNTGWTFPGYQLPAKVIDMADSNNWHIRFDGPVGSYLALGSIEVADIYGTGQQDILVAAPTSNPDGHTCTGSIYVIAHSLYTEITGTGNVVDLDNPESYTLRIDGPAVSSCVVFNAYGSVGKLKTGDLNQDGQQDIIIASQRALHNDRANSGSVYVLYNELIREKTVQPTGNTMWLGHKNEADEFDNFSLRFDGAIGVDNPLVLLGGYIEVGHVTGVGADLLMTAYSLRQTNYKNQGALYVIGGALLSTWTGTGNTIDLETNTNYTLRIDGPSNVSSIMGLYFSDAVGDLDNDSKDDLVIGVSNIDSTRTALDAIGGIYVIYNTTLRPYLTGTGRTIDLGDSVNPTYNLLFSTGAIRDLFGWNGTYVITDLNRDGHKWLILAGSYYSSSLDRAQNGSVYLIPYTLLSRFSGTGNLVDLNNTTNFYLRLDGAGDQYLLGDMFTTVQDHFGLKKYDLITGGAKTPSENTTVYGPNDLGWVYIISNEKLNNQPHATGNIMDMANAANYSLLYQGAPTATNATTGTHLIGPTTDRALDIDLNNDGVQDTLLAAHMSPFTNGTRSGSLYLIYNFTHTITASLNDNAISGTVITSDSTSTVTKVQYSVDNNKPTATTWKNCQGTTSFTCTLAKLAAGTHKIYIRAKDTNGVYTVQTKYVVISLHVAATMNDSITYSIQTTTPVPEATIQTEAPTTEVPTNVATPTISDTLEKNPTSNNSLFACFVGVLATCLIILLILLYKKKRRDDSESQNVLS